MAAPVANDVMALIPKPSIVKVGGEELRLHVLPIRKVLEISRFVEENVDILEKFGKLGQPKEKGGLSVSEILEQEVYKRLNALLRILFNEQDAAKLTDEWCLEHLSNAHYFAIFKTAIQQNQLEGLFSKAKEFLGERITAALRQAQDQGTTKTQ